MEVIQKKIVLEDSTGRLGTKIPSFYNNQMVDSNFDSYSDWGKYPCDILIMKNEQLVDFGDMTSGRTYTYSSDIYKLKNKLPLSELEINKTAVLRYSVMCEMFHYLKEFMMGCEYYRPCKRGNTYKWVKISDKVWGDIGLDFTKPKLFIEKFFLYDWPMYDVLPSEDMAAVKFGEIGIIVNPDNDVFKLHFRIDNDSKRYEKTFYYFVTEFINRNYREHSEYFSNPYVSLPLYLETEYDDIGTYTPYLEQWIPNKRYYSGATVQHQVDDNDPLGSVYRLTNMSNCPYDEISITKEIYETNSGFTGYSSGITDGNVIYKLRIPYFKGYYDTKTKITYFDEFDDNGKPKHWTKWTESNIDSGTTTEIHSYGESYLDGLMRRRKSVDENGIDLPFNLDDSSTNNTQLRFALGNINVVYENGKMHCDRIESISFYDKYGNQSLPTTDPVRVLDVNIALDCEYIKFEYYDGVQIDDNGDIIPSTGVFHSEVYHFTRDAYLCPVSDANAPYEWMEVEDYPESGITDATVSTMPDPIKGYYNKLYRFVGDSTKEFKYNSVYICYPEFLFFNIDYENTYIFNEEQSAFTQNTGRVSSITYYGEQVKDDDFQVVSAFTSDCMIGVGDVDTEINANIERGIVAAYERHHILSEINTFQDLENYKNNYFKL